MTKIEQASGSMGMSNEPYAVPSADTCRVIQVIETTLTRRGDGKTAETAMRVIRQYWTLDGALIAEFDQMKDTL